ncbi:MAG: hypothetical protein ABI240_08395 [Sphingomonas sp.]
MTSISPNAEISDTAMVETAAGTARKPWSTPLVIVAESQRTEGGNSVFTDGTSSGVPYGS